LEADFGKLFYVTRESEHYERLLKDIHRLSLGSSVRLLGIQPRMAENVGDFRRFQMQVDLEGIWTNYTSAIGAARPSSARGYRKAEPANRK